jgi:N-methylhydantoinase A
MKKILAVEIGGTFTDVVCLTGEGRLLTLKIASTPEKPEQGVFSAIAELRLDVPSLDEFIHGSTIATNTIIERKGARTAFITTAGFKDILNIQRGDKRNTYDIFYKRPAPLLPADLCFEVKERTDAAGGVIMPLDDEDIERLVRLLDQAHADSIAICLLHSYVNPAHERKLKEALSSRFPSTHIALSSEIQPEFREYERASTTVMSAYIAPIVESYISSIQQRLHQSRFSGAFLIMQSNGGILNAEQVVQRPISMLLSGPAAGVDGAIQVASQCGIENIITFDMGGTSTDVCLINRGKPEVNTENQIAGLPMGAPMIDIVNVGAGGGSIAWIDQGGMMRVGPQSAGAQPGPVCYGKGGQTPTVTDAYVAMGLLRPTQFIGGKFPLDKEKAVEALRLMAGRTGQQELELAESIFNIASHNALQAIRIICTERGYDARDYVLVAFGGAGPLHAAIMAEEIGIRTVLVPRNAGLISAMGLMLAEWKRDYCRTRLDRLDQIEEHTIKSRFHSLEAQAVMEFQAFGSSKQELEFQRSLDMRYEGQAYEINVALSDGDSSPAAIREDFRAAHQRRFGYIRDEADLLIVNYRISAVRRKDGIRLEDLYGPASEKEAATSRESRPQEGRIFSKGRFHSAAFYARTELRCGERFCGPAVVEEYSSGCYVPEGWLARVDPLGNLLLTRKA